MIRFALLFFLLASFIPRTRSEPLALENGELFKFRVGWGIFVSAGEIIVDVREDRTGEIPELHVLTTTSTRGLIRQFYNFDAEADSIFDARDGRLLTARAESNTGKKRTKTAAMFDYTKKEVRYADFLNTNRSAILPLPPGNPVDLITSLILTRNWNLKPGEKRPVVVMFDDEFYELTIVAERYDRVHAPWGYADTLVLEPIMEKDPKGMFKKGGQVRVWISQDSRHLPVKFEVVMKFGTGTAYLSEYRSPTKASFREAADADSRP